MIEQRSTRSGRLKQTRKQSETTNFRHSHALVIGINDYANGIRPLTTPVNDATRLAQVLAEEHGYDVHLLVEGVTKARLEAVLTEELPPQVGKNDRLLLYFAGHGIALDGDDGPQGFLVPQDANAADRDTLLPMTQLHRWLDALTCRHMLAILDCCFAGAFRWASTRRLDTAALEVIHQERYQRFLRSPAWQVLTSAAYDQEALDLVAGRAVGSRGVRRAGEGEHSPFALALYQALRGDGDLIPKGDGDGLITATELYLYLREQVEVGVGVEVGHDQTPGLWPLNRHDRGEYVFLTPGHALNLPPAPELTDELNPWRGLKSYDPEHGELFFGREQEIQELAQRVAAQPFTAVLGASGTGKSSLVKAGLLPKLETEGTTSEEENTWVILPPFRPGRTPLQSLHRFIRAEMAEHASRITPAWLKLDPLTLSTLIAAWRQVNPGRKLLLVIDQMEELITLSSEQERAHFLALLAKAISQHHEAFRLIVTLRTDFEPQFDADTPLASLWPNARYVVPPLDQADLRTVIEGPASVRVLYFDPPELVDDLISEVIQTPGALPLLSFALSEMYIHYVQSDRDDRALTEADYTALGGVVGSLRNRADDEYQALSDNVHRETMQRVMLRMIAVEGGQLARRRVYRSELVYPTEAENKRVQTVLDRLVAARLLVTGEEQGEATYEPAHDALVLAWDRLLRWKQAAEQYLPLQRRLAQSTVEWARAEPKARSGFLWDTDPRLPQLEEILWPTIRGQRGGLGGRLRWARQVVAPNRDTPQDTQWLNGREVAFVQASVQARAGFWRRALMITTVVITALTALAVIATIQANTATIAQATAEAESTRAVSAEEDAIEQADIAETRRVEAERQARISRAGELAAQAQIEFEESPPLGLLLALEANLTTLRESEPPVIAAEQALWNTLSQASGKPLIDYQNQVESASVSQDGRWLVAVDDRGALLLLNTTMTRPAFEQLGAGVEFRPGRSIWQQFLWDDHNQDSVGPAFSPNSHWLVAQTVDGALYLWDLTSDYVPANKYQIPEDSDLSTTSDVGQVAAFSTDSRRLAVANPSGEATIWNLIAGDGPVKGPILAAPESASNFAMQEIAFSPDDGWLVASTDSKIIIWDLEGSKNGQVLQESTSVFFTFSQDSRWLAAGDRLWELQRAVSTSNPVLSFANDSSTTRRLVVEPGGRWLIREKAAGEGPVGETRLEIWDLSLSTPENVVEISGSRIWTISPDGRWLTSWVGNINGGAVELWELEQLASPEPPPEPIRLEGFLNDFGSWTFSPDGRWLAATVTAANENPTIDNKVRLWDLEADAPTFNGSYVLQGHENIVSVLPVQNDKTLFTVSRELLLGGGSAIRTWDLGVFEHKIVGDIIGFQKPTQVSQGRLLIENDGVLDVWELGSPSTSPMSFRPLTGQIEDAHMGPLSRWLLLQDRAGHVRLWDLVSEYPDVSPFQFSGLDQPLDEFGFSPDGEWLAIVGADDHLLRLWEIGELEQSTGPVLTGTEQLTQSAPVFSSNSEWLVGGRELWRLADGAIEQFALVGAGASSAFSPKGGWLAQTVDETGGVVLRELTATGPLAAQEVSRPDPEADPCRELQFSPDGQWLSCTYRKNSQPWTILWWFGSDGSVSKAQEFWGGRPVFSQDSKWMISPLGGGGGGAALSFGWLDLETDDITNMTFVTRSFNGYLIELELSSDGKWLGAGLWDSTARLWDLSNALPYERELTLQLEGNAFEIAFSPDGRWFAMQRSFNGQQQIRIWPLEVDKQMAEACHKAGRNLTLAEWNQFFVGETYRKTCPEWPVHPSVDQAIEDSR